MFFLLLLLILNFLFFFIFIFFLGLMLYICAFNIFMFFSPLEQLQFDIIFDVPGLIPDETFKGIQLHIMDVNMVLYFILIFSFSFYIIVFDYTYNGVYIDTSNKVGNDHQYNPTNIDNSNKVINISENCFKKYFINNFYMLNTLLCVLFFCSFITTMYNYFYDDNITYSIIYYLFFMLFLCFLFMNINAYILYKKHKIELVIIKYFSNVLDFKNTYILIQLFIKLLNFVIYPICIIKVLLNGYIFFYNTPELPFFLWVLYINVLTWVGIFLIYLVKYSFDSLLKNLSTTLYINALGNCKHLFLIKTKYRFNKFFFIYLCFILIFMIVLYTFCSFTLQVVNAQTIDGYYSFQPDYSKIALCLSLLCSGSLIYYAFRADVQIQKLNAELRLTKKKLEVSEKKLEISEKKREVSEEKREISEEKLEISEGKREASNIKINVYEEKLGFMEQTITSLERTVKLQNSEPIFKDALIRSMENYKLLFFAFYSYYHGYCYTSALFDNFMKIYREKKPDAVFTTTEVLELLKLRHDSLVLPFYLNETLQKNMARENFTLSKLDMYFNKPGSYNLEYLRGAKGNRVVYNDDLRSRVFDGFLETRTGIQNAKPLLGQNATEFASILKVLQDLT